MSRNIQPVSLEIVHFISGFTDVEPDGLTLFLELRSNLSELKQRINPIHLDCVKSRAKKADWVAAFVKLSSLERRALVMRYPMMIALLPRDIKKLGLKSCKACGIKVFNPGKRIEFNVYGVFDVMSALTPKRDANAA